MWLSFLLACSASVPPGATSAPISSASGPSAGAGSDEVLATMGGEPILPTPVVLGGLATADVEAGIEALRPGIATCYEAGRATRPKLSGKVLLKFTVARDGSVIRASTRSTSLRDPSTESCLHDVVTDARFPPLATGEVAIVTYPFVFPPPDLTTPR